MKHKRLTFYAALLPLTLGAAACQDEVREEPAAVPAAVMQTAKPGPSASGDARTSPGKPSAPISMEYEVLGNPVVGAPVQINVRISAGSEYGPVEVHYSIVDRSALTFQQGQVERLRLRETDMDNRQQLAVIPRREGRSFVNVSAEVQTPGGVMIKSMAIPIQVGSAPEKPQLNGELVEGPDGETVISMPAKEN
jgi:hypothetical protein